MNTKNYLMKYAFILIISIFLLPFKAQSEEPIIVGLCTDMELTEGREVKLVAEMAIEEINRNGGVNVEGKYRPFKLVAASSRDMQPGIPISDALMAYEKLLIKYKPVAMVPWLWGSEATLAAMDITAKYKVPYFINGSMSPKVPKKIASNYDLYKYNFKLNFNSIDMIGSYLGLLKTINKNFGFSKIFILNEEALWAKASGDYIEKTVKKWNGWEVAGHHSFPKGTTDYSSSLLKIKNSGAQIVAFFNSGPGGVVFIEQHRTMHIPTLITGMIPPISGHDMWKVHKGKIKGVILYTDSGTLPPIAIDEAQKFYSDFKAAGRRPPQSSHGLGCVYDGMYILKEAIERSNSLDPEKLVAEIEKTDRKGINGRIRFDKEDHSVKYGTNFEEESVPIWFQWKDSGKREIIYPKSISTGLIELPPGLKKNK